MSRSAKLKRQGGGVRRLLSFLVVLTVGALVAGFVAFAFHVDGLAAPEDLPKADGIVVWTGPGGGRLETAGALLRSRHGERLLVSGVNPSLSEEALSDLVGVSEDKAACCLDIDYAALDTRGNARETAQWAEALGYEHVLLVTSAYHMPRARIEISHETGLLRITPVPVRPDVPSDWWRDRERFQRLFGEYGKYLMVVARGRGEQEKAREPVLPEAPLSESDASG
ncbi:MAG: YdcF family protein [Pseudomonadota bacterium]